MNPVYALIFRACGYEAVYLALWMYIGEKPGHVNGVTYDSLAALCRQYGSIISAAQVRSRIAKLVRMGLIELAQEDSRGRYSVFVFSPWPEPPRPRPTPDHDYPLFAGLEDFAPPEPSHDIFDAPTYQSESPADDNARRVFSVAATASPSTSAFHFHFHFQNENGNRNEMMDTVAVAENTAENSENTGCCELSCNASATANELDFAINKKEENKKKIKKIKKQDIFRTETAPAVAEAEEDQEGADLVTCSPSASEVRNLCDFDAADVRSLRSKVARVLYEDTVHPDVIDRATAAIVLGIGGFDLPQLRRINAEAEHEAEIYRESGGLRGKKYRWMITNLRLKRLYRLHGWAYPATRLGYEMSPFKVREVDREHKIEVSNPQNELEQAAELAVGYDETALARPLEDLAREIIRPDEPFVGAMARAAAIKNSIRILLNVPVVC